VADTENCIGLLGATSLVGRCLLALLSQDNRQVKAYSRKDPMPADVVALDHSLSSQLQNVEWRRLPATASTYVSHVIPLWICVAPIWVVPTYFEFLQAHGVKRIVVLSSTSRFTKTNSNDYQEQAIATRLANAEMQVQEWAERCGIEWVILRPTLIYGLGQDKNVVEIARFIRRFGFFPLFGRACGLRQPIHVMDVAAASIAAVDVLGCENRAYNISGGETLSYRDMVARIFASMGCRPRMLTVPLWMFSAAVAVVRCLPRYRKWSSSMAERMNMDMVFDHSAATQGFNFKPKVFALAVEDLPK